MKAEKSRKRLKESIGLIHHWDNEVVSECVAELDQLEADAELGRAVRKAFEKFYYLGVGAYVDEDVDDEGEIYDCVSFDHTINNEKQLLEWAEEVE